MLSTGEREVLRWSIAARLLTVLLAFVTSLVVSPFDTSGRLALATAPESYDNSSNSDVISKLALPFTQWDTIHFLAIARDGYADEQKFAFLPGMPGLLAVSGRLPYYLGLSERVFSPAIAVLSVSLLALSLSCFTPVLLYRLTLKLFTSRSLARTTSLLYVLSPAPAIFSVPYTEPFFAFFAFKGMLSINGTPRSYIKATLYFAMAAVFRANGILNIGFLAWNLIWQVQRIRQGKLLRRLVLLLVLSVLVALPFAAHQAYAYRVFCLLRERDPRPWCERSLPMVYSFVQDHYWNVGFLRYWTVQQLPNFILAAPVLCLSFSASFNYYSKTWPQCFYNSLPFTFNTSRPSNEHKNSKTQHAFFNIDLLPFIHLHTILAIILLFASHVQIALRQACTNPLIFWYAAYLMEKGDWRAKWWTSYCIVWGAVSVVLWTSFYPPA